MTHPNKVKGNKFERDCVKTAELRGLIAKRAWASDGRSLGYSSERDIIIKTVIIVLVVVVGGTGRYYWAMYLKGEM